MRPAARTWFLNDFMKGGAREKRPPPGVEKRMLIFLEKEGYENLTNGPLCNWAVCAGAGFACPLFSDAVEAVSEPRGVRIVPWRARRDLNPRPFPERVSLTRPSG